MKKTYGMKSALAIAALGIFGFVGSAQAVVNLDVDPVTGTAVFATEINVDTTDGTALANPGDALNVTTAFGFGASEGEQRFIRVDLSNDAEFVAEPSYAVGTGTVATSVPGTGSSYVIFQVTAAIGGLAADAVGTVTTAAAGIRVFNEEGVVVTVRQFETGVDAVNETSALATATGTMIDWTNAIVADTDPVTPRVIDVAAGSALFVGGGDTTIIGDVNVLLRTPAPLATDGLAITFAELIDDGSALTVNGDFTAVQDLTNGVPDGTYTVGNVFFAASGNCDAPGVTLAATSIEDQEVIFETDDTEIADATALCMIVNGESTIAPGSYTGLYTPVSVNATAYTIPATNLGILSTLTKNGSTDVSNVVLPAGSNYPAYIRVSNPSNIGGNVYLTVFMNDGTSSGQFPLSDVAGQPAALAGGASTATIPVEDVFEASGLSGSGNIRIQVDAETTEIDIKNVILSKTGESFIIYE